jgi:hypothetical protein
VLPPEERAAELTTQTSDAAPDPALQADERTAELTTPTSDAAQERAAELTTQTSDAAPDPALQADERTAELTTPTSDAADERAAELTTQTSDPKVEQTDPPDEQTLTADASPASKRQRRGRGTPEKWGWETLVHQLKEKSPLIFQTENDFAEWCRNNVRRINGKPPGDGPVPPTVWAAIERHGLMALVKIQPP